MNWIIKIMSKKLKNKIQTSQLDNFIAEFTSKYKTKQDLLTL